MKFILGLLAFFAVFLLGCSQTAVNDNMMQQDEMMEKDSMMKDDKMENSMEDHAMPDEGFEMKNGKMVMVNMKTKTEVLMAKDAILNDGTKVMINGKVMMKNGTNFVLKEGESMWMDGMFMAAENHMEGVMMETFIGDILAGTTSKYIEFNKADYDKSVKENKRILLYFYANWCPKCKAEQVDTTAAFNDLSDENLVGFRVNWRDGEDDADEIALAKEHGITSQHTKVIIENGKRTLKSPERWDREKYLEELA